MNFSEFSRELDARIAKYDLLQHPFYQAWTAGELDREDLREYAVDYYEHVRAFPTYLAALALRLEDGSLRRAVLANLNEELGRDRNARPVLPEHAQLWMYRAWAEYMDAPDWPALRARHGEPHGQVL